MGGFLRGRVAALCRYGCVLLAAGCAVTSTIDVVDVADACDAGDATCLVADVGCAYDSFDCNPAVADVAGQLLSIRATGSALGFGRGVMTAPTRDHHWQSVQRMAGAHSNYLLVTRSTSRVDDADLGIVQLASRGTDGGLLESNRIAGAAPPEHDRIVAKVFSETAHTHAGGTQLMGKILAVPLEDNIAGSQVALYDVSAPEQPRQIGLVDHAMPDGRSSEAGTVGLVRLDDGRYLLVIGRRDARTLDFYRSTTTDIRATAWAFHDTWGVDELRTTIDDDNFGAYQNLQLIAGADGALYLIGLHEDGLLFRSHWVDLFDVRGATDLTLTKIAKRRLDCDGAGEPCNLDAGGGSYIDPSGRMILYGIEHASTGPASSVKLMEF